MREGRGFNNGISAVVPVLTCHFGFNNGISAVVPVLTCHFGFNNGISAVVPALTCHFGFNNGISAVVPNTVALRTTLIYLQQKKSFTWKLFLY
ncbi:hypothetical protein [Paenibacillus sp. HW567]|uniref:hypothetical protein n=1 Tax=Paenibacillus sp. HW567 TaxID=1034769 RepID=UPI000363923C|nr:hypothetical protein [Paenibacillus sp. HW567]